MEIVNAFLNASIKAQIIIIIINLLFGIATGIVLRIKNIKYALFGVIFLQSLIYVLIAVTQKNLSIIFYLQLYVFPIIAIGFITYGILYLIEKSDPINNMGIFDIMIPYNTKKMFVNIKRGVSVQGAAGSGKTLSVAAWILYWFGLRDVPGVVYDYKDFELVEMVQHFYKNSSISVHAFAPHKPDKSIDINFLSPELLVQAEDINLIAKAIVSNVIGSDKGNVFFSQAAEGAIKGIIYTLKEKHPSKCTFPYLIAIISTKDADELVTFIEQSPLAAINARAFLDSADSPKQMAGVKASLSNAFAPFLLPNLFFTMNRNSIPLNINSKENLAVICLVNIPKYDDVYSPVISMTIQTILSAMSLRGKEPSYVLIDEAPTLNINRIGRIPATLRSFDIATIYMLQDKIQATVQMGADRMKEVLSNLSTLFFGKTNDPDTAKFFESYFDTIKVKTKSTSFKGGGFGSSDKRTSISEKEEKKHKSQEMFKRDTGEFFVFDHKGKGYDAKIKNPPIDIDNLEPFKDVRLTTSRQIQSNFDNIIKTAKKL